MVLIYNKTALNLRYTVKIKQKHKSKKIQSMWKPEKWKQKWCNTIELKKESKLTRFKYDPKVAFVQTKKKLKKP